MRLKVFSVIRNRYKHAVIVTASICACTITARLSAHVRHMNMPKEHPETIIRHLRPDFYSAAPRMVNDTTYQFECYDVRDSIMDADTVVDFGLVRYVSLFQKYIDYKHTYKDKSGKEQPLPVSTIVYRYDRIGNNGWIAVDYAANKMSSLKEFRDQIVRTDTLNNSKGIFITQYYKTVANKILR